MTWHSHPNLNPNKAHKHHLPHPHQTLLPVSGVPSPMNLIPPPPSSGLGPPTALGVEVLQDASQGPAAGQVHQGPGAAGDEEGMVAGTWGTTVRSVTDDEASSWLLSAAAGQLLAPPAKAPETHQPPACPPAPSAAGSSGHQTGHGPDGHSALWQVPECSRNTGAQFGVRTQQELHPKALPGSSPSMDSSLAGLA